MNNFILLFDILCNLKSIYVLCLLLVFESYYFVMLSILSLCAVLKPHLVYEGTFKTIKISKPTSENITNYMN